MLIIHEIKWSPGGTNPLTVCFILLFIKAPKEDEKMSIYFIWSGSGYICSDFNTL